MTLGDGFFSEQIFPLLEQFFLELFQHLTSLPTSYCTHFLEKVNVLVFSI